MAFFIGSSHKISQWRGENYFSASVGMVSSLSKIRLEWGAAWFAFIFSLFYFLTSGWFFLSFALHYAIAGAFASCR
jgi:hypothetical protein